MKGWEECRVWYAPPDDVATIPLYYTIAPLWMRRGSRGPGPVPMVQLGNAWNIHT